MGIDLELAEDAPVEPEPRPVPTPMTLARAEALEEAAKLCEEVALHFVVDNKNRESPRAVGVSGALKCAWNIRQLAKKGIDR